MVEKHRSGDSARTRSRDHHPIASYPPQSGFNDTQAELLTYSETPESRLLENKARPVLLRRLDTGLILLRAVKDENQRAETTKSIEK